ncbi:MAG: isoprenylcysteine carboxylmethyltransferase family protein [Microbacteriaceae bacterium]
MRWGRAYFAVQALAGAAWWVAVFTSPWVREMTLGRLDPVIVAALDIPLFVIASAIAAAGITGAAWIAAGWTTIVALGLAGYATVTTEAGWGVLIMAAAAGGSVVALSLMVLGRVPTEWIAAGPFAFRSARADAGTGRNLATVAAQIIVFWGLFLIVIPSAVVALESRWRVGIALPPPAPGGLAVAGVALLVLASALGLWSAGTMATRGRGTPLPSAMPTRLVIAGPYRLVRNPMAVAGIVQGIGVGLVLSSWLVVAYAVVGSVLWNYAVRPLEERDLEERFGDEFRRYRDAVRCWLPRLPRTASRLTRA